ncbi:Uncharacterized protein OS=Sorangium cellulosum (strain So ce56) GN=sce5710 PE=4 SV=1 [Gemmata massiliana]|uniref:SMI1/KNR4 family protein n=1 Tax=Gemmata massiliana TaxID=1210884 RepID=A0A6P2D166_9BACT|nr:hypothetical protein [Gemmata massiliana]VTR93152.1 Uncharacterized protein OS=Sorangium cellulosum (strain So ce56) GN=sce5710 PE=4 SV=1 [Gemmata massiliana]
MTEAEWLVCEDSHKLCETVLEAEVTSRRKLRLLEVARCRDSWHLFSDERSRAVVTVVERYADGLATHAELSAARHAAWDALAELRRAAEAELEKAGGEEHPSVRDAFMRAGAAAIANIWSGFTFTGGAGLDLDMSGRGGWSDDRSFRLAHDVLKDAFALRSNLIRCIFGNPFRPVTFLPEWRTSTVVALVGQMYESRDFGAMPILGDALQDAGCDSTDVLEHCRGPGPHVRGCWVVDLVLGKE